MGGAVMTHLLATFPGHHGARRPIQRRAAALLLALVAVLFLGPNAGEAVAAKSTGYVTARPTSIDFGKKQVGGEYYKRTRITNTSGQPVLLKVEAGLPDDFHFGLLPGNTCPVLDPALLQPRESCYAVVGFTPSEFFAGWLAEGQVLAHSYDPATGALLETYIIPVSGMAVL